MNRWPAFVVSLVLVCTGMFQSFSVANGAEYQSGQDASERNLRREVILLHLINGLDLTAEQMRFALARAYQARDLWERLLTEQGSTGTQAVLAEFRNKLMNREAIEPKLWRQVGNIQHQKHELEDYVKTEITRLAEEVESQLDGAQLYALRDYIPCVIPPAGESNIGQAASAGRVRALERLRKVPEQVYRHQRMAIAGHTLELLARKLPVGYELPGGEEQELARIAAIFDQARSLSDVEFALQQEELAEQLAAPYYVHAGANDVKIKITRHLLCPQIIPLLEEKLGTSGR